MNTTPNKIPVRAHPYFWLMALMLGWMSSHDLMLTVITAGVIFISILVHEFGHALTSVAFGQSAEIELVALGGLMRPSGLKLKPWQHFLMVLNGPLAGFLLYFILLKAYQVFGPFPYLFDYAIRQGLYINFYWSVFNLLPVYPMDGGHLLKIILEKLFGQKGVNASFFISMVVGALGTVYFLLQQNLIGGSMLFMFMFESYRAWKESPRFSEFDHDKWLQRLYREAVDDFDKGDVERAYHKFVNVRERSGKGLLFVRSTEYIGQALAWQGKYQEAIGILQTIEKKLAPQTSWLLQHLYYRTGNYQKAVQQGVLAYKAEPRWEAALINALSYSQLGDVRAAVGWLQCAQREGLANVDEVVQKPDFDPIRMHDLFQNSFVRS